MLGLAKDFNREVRTNMNEGSKFLALELAILAEFLHRVQLLVDPREKMAWMFEFPMKRIENLMEQWKKGLALPLAGYYCFKIEISARQRVWREVVKGRIANEMRAQCDAKSRGEESRSVDEDRIKLEASRELNDLWRDSVEHQAAM